MRISKSNTNITSERHSSSRNSILFRLADFAYCRSSTGSPSRNGPFSRARNTMTETSQKPTAAFGRGRRRRSRVGAAASHLWEMARETPRQALQVTLLRFVLAATRYVWFVLVLKRLKTAAASDGVAETTIEHNQRGMFDLAVERSLRLIRPLVALEWVRNHL